MKPSNFEKKPKFSKSLNLSTKINTGQVVRFYCLPSVRAYSEKGGHSMSAFLVEHLLMKFSESISFLKRRNLVREHFEDGDY